MIKRTYAKGDHLIRLLLLFLLFLPLWAQLETRITAIKGSSAKIEPVQAVKGMSGIVIHHFDADHSTIVARAIYQGSDTIVFDVYDALAQESLPKPKILPHEGDEVLLGYLYDRSLLIAPNLQTYQHYVATHPDTQWLHPDLFAVELSKARHPVPQKEDFKNFCNKFAVGTIHFVLKNRVVEADCYTLSAIHSDPFTIEKSTIKLPFYSRIKEIESSIFDFFGPKEIPDYFSYYAHLLEAK